MPPPAVAVSRNLDFLDSRILGQLKPFDLAGSIEEKEEFAVGLGSFSDVFKGVCILKEGKVVAAMKRLRVHVDARSCKSVCYPDMSLWYYI